MKSRGHGTIENAQTGGHGKLGTGVIVHSSSSHCAVQYSIYMAGQSTTTMSIEQRGKFSEGSIAGAVRYRLLFTNC